MKIRRKLFALILSLAALLNMAVTGSATQDMTDDDCIQQIMNYYRYHKEEAAVDIDCLLYELGETNPYKAQDWSSIMDYWYSVNQDMTLYPSVLPDGLPEDDTLCIVVMGYALNPDGSMRDELYRRLETALASAQKYPNAYVVCTGGGTAKENKNRTEAGEMSRWLLNRGVAKERIIVEDQSFSTVANAINTCRILANEYPFVTHLAIVTSDYHIPRSCLLFHAQATLTASKGAPLLCVAANAAYVTGRNSESIETQAESLSQLVGIPISGMPKPELSKLDHISVWSDEQYSVGTEPALQVIAHYNSGLCRDVSRYAAYTGIDLAAAGVQDITVTYSEDDKEVSATHQIEMVVPETEPPAESSTLPSVTLPPVPAESEAKVPTQIPAIEDAKLLDSRWILPAVMIVALLITVVTTVRRLVRTRRRRKIIKRREAARAAAKQKPVHLPDDDSPVEYI